MELTDEQKYAIQMADHKGRVMPSMAFPDLPIINGLKELGLVMDDTIHKGVFKGAYWPKLTPKGFKVKATLGEPVREKAPPLGKKPANLW